MARRAPRRAALDVTTPVVRHHPVAVSTTASALAWARQEDAPEGATVVVDHEISPLGWRGRAWEGSAEQTLSFAVVLRPSLSPERSDVIWALAADAVGRTIEAQSSVATRWRWPDRLVRGEESVAATKIEAVLGPAIVRAAVVAVRLDVEVAGLGGSDRALLAATFASALVEVRAELERDPVAVLDRCSERCAFVGQRALVRLLPRGEARGTVQAIDDAGRLVLTSATGMVDRLPIDQVASVSAVTPEPA